MGNPIVRGFIMTEEEIKELQEHDKLMEELKCSCGGFQMEDRNCWAGYIQYKCTHCGKIESYRDKSDRAWKAMGHDMSFLRLFGV
jgi:hypothetical protein